MHHHVSGSNFCRIDVKGAGALAHTFATVRARIENSDESSFAERALIFAMLAIVI